MRGPASASHAYNGSITERQGSEAVLLNGYRESAGVAVTGMRYYGHRIQQDTGPVLWRFTHCINSLYCGNDELRLYRRRKYM
jgi:hypothetical protein